MSTRLTRRAIAATSVSLATTRILGLNANVAPTPEANPAGNHTNTPCGRQIAWVRSVINSTPPIPTEDESIGRFSAELMQGVPVD